METKALRRSGRTKDDRRARRFARLWAHLDQSVDEQIRHPKEVLLRDLPSQVLEIGPGTGSNMPYLTAGTRLLAVEPNVHFHEALRATAARHDIELDLHGGDLRSARLDDASQDVVISTLVLCSVADVPDTLDEIARILRPGGRLLFVEHVAAAPGTAQSIYQRLVRRPWRAIADGCDPCAATTVHLARSRLRLVDTHLERYGPALDPTNLVYWGTAVRDHDAS